jgi:hypothetical protein
MEDFARGLQRGAATRIAARAFWLPKSPDAAEEWEDGVALSEATMRFAVADGASAGFDSREWARALVTAYRDDPPARGSPPHAAAEWLRRTGERHHARSQDARSQDVAAADAWMYTRAEREGSFAAFLGLRFWPLPPDRLGWEAVAVGDCCLFHVRESRLLDTFPLRRPDQFTRRPDLVPSAPRSLSLLTSRVLIKDGVAEPGDLFLLGTDEISKWLLGQGGTSPVWRDLRDLRRAGFRALVEEQLAAGAMEADDMTLACLQVHRG